MAYVKSGYFESGLPYNRFGHGSARLVVFQGMQFENRPLTGLPVWFLRHLYKPLEVDYTMYLTMRKPGLPGGYSLRNMADDYAVMIRRELGGPVDVIGLSTGGLIAQHFAAEHPELLRRLVIHSSAHRLADEARDLHVRVSHLVRGNQWTAAYAAVFDFMSPRRGMMRHAAKVAVWLASPFGGLLLGKPADPSDMLVTYDASNEHDFEDRLAEIEAPTLVVAGDRDPFYTLNSIRETAEGIPDARLILYEGVGHPASGKRFAQDVLSFLIA
jgi:pimeloyl-ACP methyl ester carboxylesterase